ncbi:MAG TPA: ABC transporter permease [Gemmataceae bacterium]|jgi:putative ABC transport system permease protein|nr:ABC transporter permease [Gemmataceae bacterium]
MHVTHILDTSQITVGRVVMLALFVALLVALVAVGKVPLSYNARNLLVRWRVTLLTALAFTLVVFLLTVMLAFVNGMKRLTDASGQPGNVIVLANGANDEAFSTLPIPDTSNLEQQPGVLRDEKNRPMCSREVYIVVNQPVAPEPGQPEGQTIKGKINYIAPEKSEVLVTDEDGKDWQIQVPENARILVNGSDRKLSALNVDQKVWIAGTGNDGALEARELRATEHRRFVQVRGIDDAALAGRIHGFALYEGGKWFSDAGVAELPAGAAGGKPVQAVEVVLGEGLARLLARDVQKERLEAGEVFDLGPRRWVVTGVMQSAGSTFDSEAWAKRSIVGPMFGKEQLTTVVVRTKDASSATSVSEDLRTNYRPPISAQPETEYYEKLSQTNKQFTIAIYFVTVIMAFGGVFGVMNTMFAAIAQRTKDIGVLRILGFARWQLVVSFFLETLSIALVGGLIGAGLGTIADGWSATSILSSGGGGGKTVVLKLVVDANTLAIGVLFAMIMGALGGVVPALSAMRLRPLESLR